MSDPFSTHIIAPLPISEALFRALGVALRLAPTIATMNYVLWLMLEVMRRQWVNKIVETRPVQWLMHHIWFSWIIVWLITSVIILIGYCAWFEFLLILKHVQICFLGALPCGPCPVAIQTLLLPLEALLLSFCLLWKFIENVYKDTNAILNGSLRRALIAVGNPLGNIGVGVDVGVGVGAGDAAALGIGAGVNAAAARHPVVGAAGDFGDANETAPKKGC